MYDDIMISLCGNKAKEQSGSAPPVRSGSTFAADVSLEDKFAEWKKEESSAAELFNSCLSVVLPIVKEEVLIDRTPHRGTV